MRANNKSLPTRAIDEAFRIARDALRHTIGFQKRNNKGRKRVRKGIRKVRGRPYKRIPRYAKVFKTRSEVRILEFSDQIFYDVEHTQLCWSSSNTPDREIGAIQTTAQFTEMSREWLNYKLMGVGITVQTPSMGTSVEIPDTETGGYNFHYPITLPELQMQLFNPKTQKLATALAHNEPSIKFQTNARFQQTRWLNPRNPMMMDAEDLRWREVDEQPFSNANMPSLRVQWDLSDTTAGVLFDGMLLAEVVIRYRVIANTYDREVTGNRNTEDTGKIVEGIQMRKGRIGVRQKKEEDKKEDERQVKEERKEEEEKEEKEEKKGEEGKKEIRKEKKSEEEDKKEKVKKVNQEIKTERARELYKESVNNHKTRRMEKREKMRWEAYSDDDTYDFEEE